MRRTKWRRQKSCANTTIFRVCFCAQIDKAGSCPKSGRGTLSSPQFGIIFHGAKIKGESSRKKPKPQHLALTFFRVQSADDLTLVESNEVCTEYAEREKEQPS